MAADIVVRLGATDEKALAKLAKGIEIDGVHKNDRGRSTASTSNIWLTVGLRKKTGKSAGDVYAGLTAQSLICVSRPVQPASWRAAIQRSACQGLEGSIGLGGDAEKA